MRVNCWLDTGQTFKNLDSPQDLSNSYGAIAPRDFKITIKYVIFFGGLWENIVFSTGMHSKCSKFLFQIQPFRQCGHIGKNTHLYKNLFIFYKNICKIYMKYSCFCRSFRQNSQTFLIRKIVFYIFSVKYISNNHSTNTVVTIW